MKKSLIAAVLSIVPNAAGCFMVHAKVESWLLVLTFYISSVLMWLTFRLLMDDIEEGNKIDWGLSVVIPMMLPVCMWVITISAFLS